MGRRGWATGASSFLLAASLLSLLAPPAAAEDGPEVAAPESLEVEPREWSFSLTTMGYLGGDEPAYGYVGILADRDRLHLEARYGYEDRGTASLWAGMNFEVGESLRLEATPMVGGVVGRTDGLAAGYEVTLSWRRLELYTEGEFVYDLGAEEDSYFYSWSELSFSVTKAVRVGLVAQRTKAYETDLEVQRGFLVGVSVENAEITAYVLNLGFDEPIFALGLGFEF